ncbi:MAG: cytochrome c biogenesis heme-transporting ATPase CcmA [Gammaproteobacteria bacterium]|nr:cytochrome c biogenesis heme-transporting ATPase CcmA [Pseudomonadales bacterium]
MSHDSTSPAMLSARQLTCERDDRLLFEDLAFDLEEGQVLQVKGSNGSGKTTLLRILCGLNDSYSGAIDWYGRPIAQQRESYYASLLYLGHRVGVNMVLSPLENLRWACNLQAPTSDEQIYQALEKLSLRGFEQSPCHNLSAGQKQRVSLARLLISPARLWVLDEPFTTLDVYGVAALEDLLADHVLSGGSVVVTTHHALSVKTGIQVLNLDRQ